MGLLPQQRIPWLFRKLLFVRGVVFRSLRSEESGQKTVYLTFDDGPIPESTPWLLETLERYGAKATFFMVADNARRYPELLRSTLAAGHSVGNHTFHHVPPYRQKVETLLADTALAAKYVKSRLFRPPHGLISRREQKALQKAGYRIVMFDLNALDYRKDRDARQVADCVKRYVRDGSVVNLHDSLKSIDKLKTALPEILEFLQREGYNMAALPQESV